MNQPSVPLVLLVSALACVGPSLVRGAVITATSGQSVQDSALTISGSGFGSKSPAHPLKWETFEDGQFDPNWTFELGGNQAISIVPDPSRGVSASCAEMDIYHTPAANFSWIAGQPAIQTIYVYYWIRKNFTWSSSGDDAWGKVKFNRFVSGSGPTPNCYYEFARGAGGLKRVIEWATSGTAYHNWDLAGTFTSDIWHSAETTYVITPDATGMMAFAFDGQMVSVESGLDFDASSMRGFGIGLARVREGHLLPTDRYWLDDIYIDNTRARVIIGDGPALSSCNHVEIQIPTSWEEDRIDVMFNQGSFGSGDSAFLFVLDAAGAASDGYPIVVGGGSLGDTTSPSDVVDLSVGGSTPNSLTLTWTAVGDDGTSGLATSYDLRYSTAAIAEDSFDEATPVEVPAPGPSGQTDTCLVSGLTPGTTYFFALRTADEVPNWSGLSNVVGRATQSDADTIAPAPVTTLAVGEITQTTAILTWTAVGDDGMSGAAAAYDLRYATSPMTLEGFESAATVSGVGEPAAAGQGESALVTGLAPGETYSLALKVADEVPNWSGLSNVAVLTTPALPDTVPPAAVSTLAVVSTTQTSATLNWTAVGDDGAGGTAALYDVRLSTEPVTEETFGAAARATGQPLPGTTGQLDSCRVAGLAPSTTYYFALKVADEVPNWSELSNIVSETTQPPEDMIPPEPGHHALGRGDYRNKRHGRLDGRGGRRRL